eukprot:1149675-Pelagomonas_calceolata.AAC.1
MRDLLSSTLFLAEQSRCVHFPCLPIPGAPVVSLLVANAMKFHEHDGHGASQMHARRVSYRHNVADWASLCGRKGGGEQRRWQAKLLQPQAPIVLTC